MVSCDVLNMETVALQAEVMRLRRRISVLVAIVRLLLALVRLSGAKLEGRRLPEGEDRACLVRTIERTRTVLTLRSVLRVLGLSATRYHDWTDDDAGCHPEEQDRCPRRAPNQLTADEVSAMQEMATSPEYRHVPTSRLAILAQRSKKVVASATTWARLIRERGWRRPRLRIHPGKPKLGLRMTRPDEAWHVDITLVRLLDGTKAYIHAVIDNFSRRILAFRVADRFDVGNAIAVLLDAAQNAVASREAGVPMVVVDGGVENFNERVDELVASGLLRRVLAQTEIAFSNSMIEVFWRTMKHQWLFLNTLDTVAALRRHVTFYVAAHNGEIPHSAFRGQTPDEMYYGLGADVPVELEAARRKAVARRLERNRATSCAGCSGSANRSAAVA